LLWLLSSLTLATVFDTLTVAPNSLIRDEQLGSKSKFWFDLNGNAWLFKQAREHTGEDWAEKVAAEIALRIGVDAAEVELAEYQGRRGSASWSFVQPGESLVHGNEILAGQILGYDPQKRLKQSDHTLANIIAAVDKMVPSVSTLVLEDLAGYLVLDALVGNTDRHHENWGFLTRYEDTDTGRRLIFRLAPSFDHASSLGRELRDDRAEAILAAGGIEAYVRHGYGGIYWRSNDRKGANPLQLVELASQMYPQFFGKSLRAVAAMPIAELLAVVDEVPAAVMSDASRRFTKALLAFTHTVLSGLAP